MKIHEYQGKQLFRQYGVPVLRGISVTTPEAAEAAEVGTAEAGPGVESTAATAGSWQR